MGIDVSAQAAGSSGLVGKAQLPPMPLHEGSGGFRLKTPARLWPPVTVDDTGCTHQ
jgi:hypothetical protein